MLLLNYPLDTEKEEVERKRKKKEKKTVRAMHAQRLLHVYFFCRYLRSACGLHPIRQMACIFMQHGGLALLFLQ